MPVNWLHKISNIYERVIKWAFYAAGVIIVLQTLIVAGHTLMGYFFGKQITGLDSFIEWGILYCTFLAGAWVLKKEMHIKMDLLTNRLGKKPQAALAFITSIMGIFVCVLLMIWGARVAWNHWQLGAYDYSKIMGFPRAIPEAIIPIGSFLLIIQFGIRAYAGWLAFREGKPSNPVLSHPIRIRLEF